LGDTGKDVREAVDRDERLWKLARKIAALEKKVQREKQFNIQVKLNSELRRLRSELEGLG
jgi:hypothetical protein